MFGSGVKKEHLPEVKSDTASFPALGLSKLLYPSGRCLNFPDLGTSSLNYES